MAINHNPDAWRDTPLRGVLNSACTNILMGRGIRTLGELHDLVAERGLESFDQLATMEKVQIRQDCLNHGHPLPNQGQSTEPATSAEPEPVATKIPALNQEPVNKANGKYHCVIAGVRITESDCLKFSSDRTKLTQCQTAKCKSPWRLCRLCVAQVDAEQVVRMPEARVANPENGLCYDHNQNPAFRRHLKEFKPPKRNHQSRPSTKEIADAAAIQAQKADDEAAAMPARLPRPENLPIKELIRTPVAVILPESPAVRTKSPTLSRIAESTFPKEERKPMKNKPIIDSRVSTLRFDYRHIAIPLAQAGFGSVRSLTETIRASIQSKTNLSDRQMDTIARKLAEHGLAFKGEEPVTEDSVPASSAPVRRSPATSSDPNVTPLRNYFAFYKLRRRLKEEFDINSMEELEERFESLGITNHHTRTGIERALEKFREGQPAAKRSRTTTSKLPPEIPTSVSAELIPATPMDGNSPLTKSLVGALNPLVGSEVEGIEMTTRFRTPDHKRFRLQVTITPEPD